MNLATVTVWMFAASLAALPCAAQPPSRSHVEFNGFGTLGVVHSSEDRADFVNSSRQPDGAGHSSDFAFDVDSRLGIQATANPDGRVAAVIQVVAEQDEDDTYTPSIEWANLKYDITPESSIRAGRTVLPIFMVSDSRKVGYANPWLRPPTELYNLVPVTSNDGVDVLYQARAGPALTTLQAYLGQADFPTPELGRFEARNTYGASGGVLVGDIEIRAGYVHSHVTSEAVNSLFAAFRRFGPRGSAIADRFDLDDKQIEVFTVGLRYDPGRW